MIVIFVFTTRDMYVRLQVISISALKILFEICTKRVCTVRTLHAYKYI